MTRNPGLDQSLKCGVKWRSAENGWSVNLVCFVDFNSHDLGLVFIQQYLGDAGSCEYSAPLPVDLGNKLFDEVGRATLGLEPSFEVVSLSRSMLDE